MPERGAHVMNMRVRWCMCSLKKKKCVADDSDHGADVPPQAGEERRAAQGDAEEPRAELCGQGARPQDT